MNLTTVLLSAPLCIDRGAICCAPAPSLFLDQCTNLHKYLNCHFAASDCLSAHNSKVTRSKSPVWCIAWCLAGLGSTLCLALLTCDPTDLVENQGFTLSFLIYHVNIYRQGRRTSRQTEKASHPPSAQQAGERGEQLPV
eukprot:TRINITY_DN1044_c0_g1_i7.p1 TRINITY_DN1044_c0_g1~~TRINITY_DN1044_c0_g1_i7.p1  ORF type:complete len:139 (+),score=10.69 TRINITY_DN1044_c0_g1_i7:302-718(+)